MPVNLWSANTLKNFWQLHCSVEDAAWQSAIQKALPILCLNPSPSDENDLLQQVLGEGQFGAGHWELSRIRRLYYELKPFIPRTLSRALRQLLQKRHQRDFELGWTIEERYPRFQFQVLKNLMELTGMSSVRFEAFWSHGRRFAFILTHDIEEENGQAFVRAVADLEESLGFRSSFNFVPERYRVDKGLMAELRERGFEIGIHGLKHDGKLFNSHSEFICRAERINHYLNEFDAVGFRSPLTLRNPEWMQTLRIEYDLSFFDTDPFEPMPGGVMSIHPFFIGHFIELPYTLVQDYTLTSVLGETSPRMWLEKVAFIRKYHGMALVNTHPDYLRRPAVLDIYRDFLIMMKTSDDYWHVLPCEIAAWWRNRADVHPRGEENGRISPVANLENGELTLEMAHGIHSNAPIS
ncbi:MAG TPA: hypothetical protein DCY14_18720 [Anaerolineae bacterium]|jgi:peptidoglycan/xylan/chitin deacetylase (PgdA/CDA1 family)|nr:hypothetical protein [Anaerolineae bacterium]HRJ55388.1 hypothetical protein [Anaerolineales bacterium]